MFANDQEFGCTVHQQKKVLDVLKKRFGVITIKGVFLQAYHSQHGPDSQSCSFCEIKGFINVDLQEARMHEKLPFYVMRTYVLHSMSIVA